MNPIPQWVVAAVEGGDLEAVRSFLRTDAGVDSRDGEGRTILMIAMSRGRWELVDSVLAEGVPVDGRARDGTTALHYAASKGTEDDVVRLLSAGANPDFRDVFLRTALWIASARGHAGIARVLLEHDTRSLEVQDLRGMAPIHMAAWGGYVELIDVLIRFGANCDLRSQEDEVPLLYAMRSLHPLAVAALLAGGASPAGRTANGVSLLGVAATRDSADVLAAVLDDPRSRPLLDVRDAEGFTPLMLAAWRGHTAQVALLLQHQANPNRCESRETALSLAAIGGHAEIFSLLLRHGAVYRAGVLCGFHLLHQAVRGGSVAIVRQVLALGARPGARELPRWHPMAYRTVTALALAERLGNREIVDLLRRVG